MTCNGRVATHCDPSPLLWLLVLVLRQPGASCGTTDQTASSTEITVDGCTAAGDGEGGRLVAQSHESIWETPVVVQLHPQLADPLLHLVLFERHRDPIGVLKSNKLSGGWHSANLLNASVALGLIDSNEIQTAFHKAVATITQAVATLANVEPRRVFLQNMWGGINSEGQFNVGHTHPYV